MLRDSEPLFKMARKDVCQMVDVIVARRVGDPDRGQENVGYALDSQQEPRHALVSVALAESGNRLARRSRGQADRAHPRDELAPSLGSRGAGRRRKNRTTRRIASTRPTASTRWL